MTILVRCPICKATRPEGTSCPRCKPNRKTAAQRGYGSRWRTAARRFLAANPMCVQCKAEGNEHGTAEVVDHIVPHRGDSRLFWNADNWQPLCTKHHNEKTARGE